MATRASLILSFILPILILTGCASKRWSEPLQEEEHLEITTLIGKMQNDKRSCPKNLDAEAIIHWESMAGNSAVNGYLQLQSPSSLKYIVTNPLGMLHYAFASDSKSFQILDTGKRQHIRGNLHNLAIRRELPPVLVHGNWFAYLTGNLPSPPPKVEKTSRDILNQTVWAKLSKPASDRTSDEQWVNIDITEEKVLGYLFLDRNGKTVAEISYEKQGEEQGKCIGTKKTIRITNLPWGTEVKIELQDIRTDTLYTHSDFTLPVPAGYFKQLQP